MQAQKVSDKRISIIRESKDHVTNWNMYTNRKNQLSKCSFVIFSTWESKHEAKLQDTGRKSPGLLPKTPPRHPTYSFDWLLGNIERLESSTSTTKSAPPLMVSLQWGS